MSRNVWKRNRQKQNSQNGKTQKIHSRNVPKRLERTGSVWMHWRFRIRNFIKQSNLGIPWQNRNAIIWKRLCFRWGFWMHWSWMRLTGNRCWRWKKAAKTVICSSRSLTVERVCWTFWNWMIPWMIFSQISVLLVFCLVLHIMRRAWFRFLQKVFIRWAFCLERLQESM